MHAIIKYSGQVCRPVVDWAVRRRSKQRETERIPIRARRTRHGREKVPYRWVRVPDTRGGHGKPSAGSHTPVWSSHEPQRAGVKSRSREKTNNISSRYNTRLAVLHVQMQATKVQGTEPLVKIFGDRALPDITNSRLRNLKEKTLMYDFTMLYIPGVRNSTSDALSRYPTGSHSPDKLSLPYAVSAPPPKIRTISRPAGRGRRGGFDCHTVFSHEFDGSNHLAVPKGTNNHGRHHAASTTSH